MWIRLLIISYIVFGIFGFVSCRDDKNGAVYRIMIEQAGAYEPFKKQLILFAAGGLYDEIKNEIIHKPIIENTHFSEKKVSLKTREKIDVFVATLSIHPKEKIINDNYILSVIVFKNDKMVYKEKVTCTPNMQYPHTIRISK